MFDFAASIDALPYVISTDSSTLDQKLLHLSTRIEENDSDTVASLDKQAVQYQKMNMLAEPFFRMLQKEGETY
ncbi:hypothetical protein L5D93_21690 [Paenibacillus thiaminolyticus]|nr:hypothetical protein [Paenibacillus thiaminolyticus]